MRNTPGRNLALLAIFLYFTLPAWAAEVPELRRYVTDMAGVLSTGEQDRIEAMLSQYDQERSQQFVVLIISSLDGESIEDYSMRVAEKNRVGHEGEDNGLLFLVSINDRKMRFEVGYGLEGELTDAATSLIISDVVAPAFRNGNIAEGISAGMETAIKISTGEFTVSQSSPRKKKKKSGNMMGLVIFLVIMYIIVKGNRGGRGGGIWFLGGPFGGGGGGFGGGGGGFGGGGFGGFSGGGGGFGGGGASGSW